MWFIGRKISKPEVKIQSLHEVLLKNYPDRLAYLANQGTNVYKDYTGLSLPLSEGQYGKRFSVGFASKSIGEKNKGRIILEMDEVTAIDQKEIRKHLYEKIITTEDVYLDTSSHQVFVRKLEKVGEVVLSRKESPEVSEEQRVEAYANAIIDSSLKLKNWNDQVENFLARVNFLSSAHPEFAIEHFDKNAEKMVIKEICSSSKSGRK